MKKYISFMLAVILLFTSLPVAFANEASWENVASDIPMTVTESVYSQQPYNLMPQDIITVSSVAKQFGVADDWVYREITRGYQLHHIYEGLLEQERGGSYEQYMERIYPNVARKTEEEPATTVTTSVYHQLPDLKAVEDREGVSVTDAVYSLADRMASSGEYDRIALQQKELRFNQAPFSIGDLNEQISTVDGSLRIVQTDLVLPGPNGLNFELRRVYDSSRGKDDIFYNENRHRQATRKLEEDTRFPLGKGWIWDIPYLKISGDQKHLYMPEFGTFAISERNELLGYPFDDLSFGPRYGEPAGARYVLSDYKNGLEYYFDDYGLLVQINDNYDNAINFYYDRLGELYLVGISTKKDDKNTKHHNVLFIQNHNDRVEAKITYQDPVTNQSKEKVVKYIKQKISLNGRDQYVLKEVIDPVGRSTTYHYDIRRDLFFNLLKGYEVFTDYSDRMLYWGKNDWVTLGMIEHPTKAQTKFESVPVFRKIGIYAQEYQVRYHERRLMYSTNTGATVVAERQTLNFHQDIGDKFGDYTFNVSVDDGRKISRYNYTIDYEYNYDRLDSSSTYFFPPDPPILYLNNHEDKDKNSNERRVARYDYKKDGRRKDLHTKPVWIQDTSYGKTGSSQTRSLRYSYDDYGMVTQATDPLQATSYYEYDFVLSRSTKSMVKKIKKSIVPVGANSRLITEYEYETNHAGLTKVTQRDEATGRVLSQISYEYDSFGNPTTIRIQGEGSKSTVIRQAFDASHKYIFPNQQTVSVTDADGVSTDITKQVKYSSETGMMHQYIDGKGQPVTYHYDNLDRVTAVTYADGAQAKVQYDDGNNRVTVTEPDGKRTELWFDPFGRLIKETNGRGAAEHRYDEFNQLVSKGDFNGSAIRYEYDAWGRVVLEQPGYFAATRYLYDDGANTKTILDGTNNPIKETYDLMGRIARSEEIKPSRSVILSRYEYDHAGNVTSETDANNNVTKYEYDALSRLIAVTDAEGKKTRYDYDLSGDLVQITYADGKVVLKKYDEIGRLIQQTDPRKQKKKIYYDPNDNVSRIVDRNGQTQTFAYNPRNVLTGSVTKDATVTYSYDASGKRVSMKDGTGLTQYAYHPSGELASIVYPDQTKLTFDYDARQLRTRQTLTARNVTMTTHVDYRYEQAIPDKIRVLDGKGTSLSELLYEYSPQTKQLTKFAVSNGFSETYTYDGFNLSGIRQMRGNSLIGQYTYQYDINRNMMAKNDNGAASKFSYDRLNRIKTSSQFNEVYTYDQRDNRSTLRSDQVPTLKGASYAYDHRNRLTRVTTEEGKAVSYRYNGDNLMVERTEGGQTTRYYYDERAKIAAEGKVEANGSVTITAAYIYDTAGKLVARQIPGQSSLQYYVTNGHGDIMEIQDATGKVLNRYTYDIWGNPLKQEEQVPNIFRYAGEYWDAATELQYLRARWYDPGIGRFLTEDTYEGEINNPLSFNLYTYVYNNPLIYSDPTGNFVYPISPAATCAADMANCKTYLEAQAEAGKTIAVEGAKLLLLDDINTLISSEASFGEKALAAASLTPFGKAFKIIKAESKIGKLLLKCNCFTAGTKVLTDGGEKNIEDIEVGDRVLAKDENYPNGELAYKEVTALFRNQRDDIIKLHVGKQIIETTDNHPFWVEGKGWVFADELQVGDKLQKADGSNLTIDKVEFVKLDEPVTVYNFTVADYHTYYVTDIGIWVHNTNCPNGKFENAPYHGATNKGKKNKAPNDGQTALDNSYSIGPNTDRRIGISDGEFVVLDKTSEGLYHGHVRAWSELTPTMQSILRKAGLVDKKGNIK
ncbi:hypothetical protein ABD76_22045 [Paenibacillus dendritiformis]|uniref:polymorphic toxin-type HINT domain-containing protein n=1 Tax=Paenibacillus dendritiformis TaxID=130049 RepID=UPI0018CC90D3|nr:polymorphic toxin-type HINT domain-containing protein [Paenibacillus dendritiformis]MBG9795002.1 hypothetical protein [Paenibacillus dendritiformis]